MISKESQIRCHHCSEGHPAGTQFCPNTGKPLKGKGKKIILVFAMILLIGVTIFSVYRHIEETPKLPETGNMLTMTSISPATTSIPEDIAGCNMEYAQKVLKKLSLYFGRTDGLPNPDIENELKNFQMSNSLNGTGKLDRETCIALKQAERQK